MMMAESLSSGSFLVMRTFAVDTADIATSAASTVVVIAAVVDDVVIVEGAIVVEFAETSEAPEAPVEKSPP